MFQFTGMFNEEFQYKTQTSGSSFLRELWKRAFGALQNYHVLIQLPEHVLPARTVTLCWPSAYHTLCLNSSNVGDRCFIQL